MCLLSRFPHVRRCLRETSLRTLHVPSHLGTTRSRLAGSYDHIRDMPHTSRIGSIGCRCIVLCDMARRSRFRRLGDNDETRAHDCKRVLKRMEHGKKWSRSVVSRVPCFEPVCSYPSTLLGLLPGLYLRACMNWTLQ